MPIGRFRFRNSSDRPGKPQIHYWTVAGGVGEQAVLATTVADVPPGVPKDGDIGPMQGGAWKIGPVRVDFQPASNKPTVLRCSVEQVEPKKRDPLAFNDVEIEVTGANGAYKIELTLRHPKIGPSGEVTLIG